MTRSPDDRNCQFAYLPGKNDGSGRSRIVCRPGAAASTFGIEFTTIDAVAMSPWMPPAIFIDSAGEPSISTASYGSGRAEVRLEVQPYRRLILAIPDAVLNDAAHVAGIDREELARDGHRRQLRLHVVGDPIEPSIRARRQSSRSTRSSRRAGRSPLRPFAGTARWSVRRRSSAETAGAAGARPGSAVTVTRSTRSQTAVRTIGSASIANPGFTPVASTATFAFFAHA